MKKRLLTAWLVLSLFCFAFQAEASGKSETTKPAEIKKTTIKFGALNPANHPFLVAVKEFGRVLGEKSRGAIQLETFPGGTLGDIRSMIQSLQLGALDMTMCKPGVLMDYGVKSMTVLNLPYIFRDVDHVFKTLEGPIGKELLDSIAGKSLIGIGYYPESPRHFFFKNKVVKSIADMKGLKLRVQPGQMYLDIVKAFGASPTPVAYSELYSALQTGVVDGAENPLVGYFSNNFHEVAPFMTLDGHEASPSVILFSEPQWNKLSKEAKETVLAAWKESEKFYKKLLANTDANVTEKMKKAGVTITEVSNKQEWVDAVKPIYAKYAVGSETLIRRILEIK